MGNSTPLPRWSTLVAGVLIGLFAATLGPATANAPKAAPKEKAKAAAPAEAEPPSVEEVMESLRAGNERFTHGVRRNIDFADARAGTASGQHPWATVLSCADSRVPPEHIFDAGIGELFVVRAAGQVAEPVTTGSVEYAAEHLHTPVIVVMGHESCGAVKAAMGKDDLGPNLNTLLGYIRPALGGVTDLSAAVRINVHQQIEALMDSAILAHMLDNKHVTVMGAVYDLDTGVVDWLLPSGTRVRPNKPMRASKPHKVKAGGGHH